MVAPFLESVRTLSPHSSAFCSRFCVIPHRVSFAPFYSLSLSLSVSLSLYRTCLDSPASRRWVSVLHVVDSQLRRLGEDLGQAEQVLAGSIRHLRGETSCFHDATATSTRMTLRAFASFAHIPASSCSRSWPRKINNPCCHKALRSAAAVRSLGTLMPTLRDVQTQRFRSPWESYFPASHFRPKPALQRAQLQMPTPKKTCKICGTQQRGSPKACWLVGWLVGWLVWLVGWLVG